ncbi:MAG: hypothetical protein BWZ02_02911 [Lentisphaerae bacterium ADurb.BinA184]|nr:MAG: hypothetical protein BWZ02_02911 [Lentisphaerae bacterium ADurb.BinA184]
MRARWLAVNPVKGESDLTTIGEADWHAALGTRHVRTLPYEQLDGAFARRREMLPALLAAVAVAFALEAGVGAWQAVRRRRHHG